jgi:hypothetical protein
VVGTYLSSYRRVGALTYRVSVTSETEDIVKICDTPKAAYEQASALWIAGATTVMITDESGRVYTSEEFELHFIEPPPAFSML